MTDEARVKELKHRVKAKRKALESRLEELRADAAGKQADSRDSIERRLRELDDTLRDGWDDLKDATVKKLNDWLRSVETR